MLAALHRLRDHADGGRPEFVEHQLTRIAAQEAVEGGGSTGRPVSEVIVIDDSPPALRIKSLVPNSVTVIRGLRVNYFVLNRRASVGAKRNMAANAATGDVIAHWDDDDFYGSRRLGEQLRHIVQGSAVTVLPHQYTYLLPADVLYAAGSAVASKQALSWGPLFGTLAPAARSGRSSAASPTPRWERITTLRSARRSGREMTALAEQRKEHASRSVYVRTGVNTELDGDGGGAKIHPTRSTASPTRAMPARRRRVRRGCAADLPAARGAADGDGRAANLREPDDLDPDFYHRDADADRHRGRRHVLRRRDVPEVVACAR